MSSIEKRLLKREMKRLMKVAGDPSSVISSQSLFSVYTHPRPEFQYPATSIFYETEVKDRVDTANSWGRFSLVDAELRLIETALEDTNNKKFILLSESCIPLYPLEVIYAQLMSEQKSRMRSCGSKEDISPSRFSSRMEWNYCTRDNWRKNDQWFALNRAHEEVLANDTYFKNLFKWHCDGGQGRRFCVADEHYIPSALDAYGLGELIALEHLLLSSSTVVITPSLSSHLVSDRVCFWHFGTHNSATPIEQGQQCNADRARTTAAALLDGLPRNGGCIVRNLTTINITDEADISQNWVTERGYKPLECRCVLFARKFPANAVQETLWASLSCKGGSLGYWC